MSQCKCTYTPLSCSPHTVHSLEPDPARVYKISDLQGGESPVGVGFCLPLSSIRYPEFLVFPAENSEKGRSYRQNLIPLPYNHRRKIRVADCLEVPQAFGVLNVTPAYFKPFSFLFCVPGSILEPPPCKSDPENCTHFCTLQEDCHKGFQCCSAFCGIVCTLNINIKHDR